MMDEETKQSLEKVKAHLREGLEKADRQTRGEFATTALLRGLTLALLALLDIQH